MNLIRNASRHLNSDTIVYHISTMKYCDVTKKMFSLPLYSLSPVIMFIAFVINCYKVITTVLPASLLWHHNGKYLAIQKTSPFRARFVQALLYNKYATTFNFIEFADSRWTSTTKEGESEVVEVLLTCKRISKCRTGNIHFVMFTASQRLQSCSPLQMFLHTN